VIPRYSLPEMARVWSDEEKLRAWLRVEVTVAEAWAEAGVIPEGAVGRMRAAAIDRGRFEALEAETHHDMIAFVRSVAEQLGDAGRFVHLGLTSSDVLDTALPLQVREAVDILQHDLDRLEAAVAALAVRHKYTPTIGRTHGVHAEPTTFGHKLAGWVAALRRDRERLRRAREEMAYGKLSGAVGTHANVPAEIEEAVCARLGLRAEPVSTQIVPRDRHAELVATLALVAATVESFATEIRHLQRTEVWEVAEPFERGQQGSSAMPHKRNPELCERVCGLARVVRAAVVPALEDVTLWHERDISHSSVERVILPDAFLALDYMLQTFARVMEGLEVHEERMRQNLESTRGLVHSGHALLALVEAGLPRNEAYQIVQGHAMAVWRGDGDLKGRLAADARVRERLSREALDAAFDLQHHLRQIDVPFERLGLAATDGASLSSSDGLASRAGEAARERDAS
jgi:adenylosuccinate lyase